MKRNTSKFFSILSFSVALGVSLSSCLEFQNNLGAGAKKKTTTSFSSKNLSQEESNVLVAQPIGYIQFLENAKRDAAHGFVASLGESLQNNLLNGKKVDDLYNEVSASNAKKETLIEVQVPYYGVKFKIPLELFFPVTPNGEMTQDNNKQVWLKNVLVYFPPDARSPSGSIKLLHSKDEVISSMYAFEWNDGSIHLLGASLLGDPNSFTKSLYSFSRETSQQEMVITENKLYSNSNYAEPQIILYPTQDVFTNLSQRYYSTKDLSGMPLIKASVGNGVYYMSYFLPLDPTKSNRPQFCKDPEGVNPEAAAYPSSTIIYDTANIPESCFFGNNFYQAALAASTTKPAQPLINISKTPDSILGSSTYLKKSKPIAGGSEVLLDSDLIPIDPQYNQRIFKSFNKILYMQKINESWSQ